jgi:hypothetical protein
VGSQLIQLGVEEDVVHHVFLTFTKVLTVKARWQGDTFQEEGICSTCSCTNETLGVIGPC